MNLKS